MQGGPWILAGRGLQVWTVGGRGTKPSIIYHTHIRPPLSLRVPTKSHLANRVRDPPGLSSKAERRSPCQASQIMVLP